MNRLIVISAPSGAGKTTLCHRLLTDIPALELSISTTTRAPRGAEQNGREYWFTSIEEFKKKIEAGRFAEWALVHGNYYGTSKDVIEAVFSRGKSVLLDIDVQGAESLRKAYPSECFSIFISPPSLEILEQRLRARRTDTEDAIAKRMKNSKTEMDEKHRFHKLVVNEELETAYQQLEAFVSQALQGGTP